VIRKYLNRIVVWGLLIVALSFGTYYATKFFLDPLDNTILDLQKEQTDIQRDITMITSQINRYNTLYFEENKINVMIPKGYQQLDIENKYVKKPVQIDTVKGTLQNYTITNNVKPEHLKLSNNIAGVKITAAVQFETMDQVVNYVYELHNSARSVYINQLTYNLPSEGAKDPFTYTVQIEYFVFYYPVK
jgi:hypothetical protein